MCKPPHRVRHDDADVRRHTGALPRPAGRAVGTKRTVTAPTARPASVPNLRPERPLVGMLALLAGSALFSMSDVVSKVLTASLPGIEVAWLRYLVFVIMTAPLLLRGRGVLRTARPGVQIGRAVAAAASTSLFIVAFGVMPVANATAIGFMAPVVVTAMAALILREKVGIRRWSAALVGLAGVIVIVQPGGSTFEAASLIPLCGSVASATAVIGTRLVKDERPETTLLYAALIGFALVSVLTGFVWQTPTWNQVAVGGITGFFATLASLMQIYAYRNAPASLLAPLSYTQLLWAAGLGYLAFGTVPGPAMLCGAAIIAASGIYTAWREAVRGKGKAASGVKPLGFETETLPVSCPSLLA